MPLMSCAPFYLRMLHACDAFQFLCMWHTSTMVHIFLHVCLVDVVHVLHVCLVDVLHVLHVCLVDVLHVLHLCLVDVW